MSLFKFSWEIEDELVFETVISAETMQQASHIICALTPPHLAIRSATCKKSVVCFMQITDDPSGAKTENNPVPNDSEKMVNNLKHREKYGQTKSQPD